MNPYVRLLFDIIPYTSLGMTNRRPTPSDDGFFHRMARITRDPRLRVWRPYEDADVALYVWIVYDHPPEFPHHFAVRRWAFMLDDVPPIPDKEWMLAHSLDAAIELIPRDHRSRVDDFPRDERKVVAIFI